jgi:hypothetical protein
MVAPKGVTHDAETEKFNFLRLHKIELRLEAKCRRAFDAPNLDNGAAAIRAAERYAAVACRLDGLDVLPFDGCD